MTDLETTLSYEEETRRNDKPAPTMPNTKEVMANVLFSFIKIY